MSKCHFLQKKILIQLVLKTNEFDWIIKKNNRHHHDFHVLIDTGIRDLFKNGGFLTGS